jgi:hypothetical protein
MPTIVKRIVLLSIICTYSVVTVAVVAFAIHKS